MKPGKFSSTGFLGTDTRNLFDIIADDNITVSQLSVSHEMIAEKLQYFRDKGFDSYGTSVTIDEKWRVTVDSFRGKLICPFEHKGLYRKTLIELIYIPENLTVQYTDLSIHMIREHGFYQGIGSRFRLEPEILVKIFALQ